MPPVSIVGFCMVANISGVPTRGLSKLSSHRSRSPTVEYIPALPTTPPSSFAASPAACVSRIAGRPIRDQHRQIVMQVRVRHAERLEDVRIREFAQRLTRRAFEDAREQVVAAVVVLVLGCRAGS